MNKNSKLNNNKFGIRFFIITSVLATSFFGFSQIKITDDAKELATPANSKALIDLVSSKKGLLLPSVDVGVLQNYGLGETGMFLLNRLTNNTHLWIGNRWIIFGRGKFEDGSSKGKISFTAKFMPVRVGIGVANPTHALQIDADGDSKTTDDVMNVTERGALILGTKADVLGASLALVSDSKGLMLPKVSNPSNVQDMKREGMLVYNSSNSVVNFYDGKNWVDTKTKFKDVITNSGNHIYYIADNVLNTQMGIGISDKLEQKLHVKGTVKAKSLIIKLDAKEGSVLKSNAFGVASWKEITGGVAGVAMTHDPVNAYTHIPFKSVKKNNKHENRIGMEVFVVKDNGNVGIGTSDPKSKLHVANLTKLEESLNVREKLMLNTLRITSSDPEEGKSFLSKSESGWKKLTIINDPAKNRVYLPFKSDGSTLRTDPLDPSDKAFVIKDDGKLGLGLGTNDPAEQLHLKGNALVNGATTSNTLTITDGYEKKSKILLYNDHDKAKGSNLVYSKWVDSPSSIFVADNLKKSIYIKYESDEVSLRTSDKIFVIKDDGKLGLGTEDPEEALHIKQGKLKSENGMTYVIPDDGETVSGTDVPNFVYSDGTEGNNKVLISNKKGEASWKEPPFSHDSTKKISYVKFRSDDSTVRSIGEKFVITDDGKLGLGTETPKYKIDIVGKSDEDRKIGIDGTTVFYLPEQVGQGQEGSLVLGDVLSSNNGVGEKNTVLGMKTLSSNMPGSSNVVAGYNVLAKQNNSEYNVVVGANATPNNIAGKKNVIIGYNTAGGLTAGSSNVVIGANVTSLPPNMQKNIVLATGDGDVKFHIREDGTGEIGKNIDITIPSENDKIALAINNTTGGFRPPVMSTIEREAIVKSGTLNTPTHLEGITVYDKDVASILYWNGKNWVHYGCRIGMRKWYNIPPGGSQFSVPPGWEIVEDAKLSYVVNAGEIQNNISTTPVTGVTFGLDEKGGYPIHDPSTGKMRTSIVKPYKLKLEQIPRHTHEYEDYSHTHNINTKYKLETIGRGALMYGTVDLYVSGLIDQIQGYVKAYDDGTDVVKTEFRNGGVDFFKSKILKVYGAVEQPFSQNKKYTKFQVYQPSASKMRDYRLTSLKELKDYTSVNPFSEEDLQKTTNADFKVGENVVDETPEDSHTHNLSEYGLQYNYEHGHGKTGPYPKSFVTGVLIEYIGL